jgi:hypothetical protein
VKRPCLDELRIIAISRLRATGLITAEMTEFVVRLGDVEQSVGLALRKFPNGGNWSRFICPSCGWKVRMLRLLDGALLCTRCCILRGATPRTWSMSPRRRAERSIPRLKAVLETETSLRQKPVLRGKMERRSHYEAALREAEFRVAQSGIVRAKAKADRVEDPCDEADFKPPGRLWPILKSKLPEPRR